MDATTEPAERADRRRRSTDAILWHVGAFAIINGFFWFLDWITGGGFTWAYWITLFWGIGLAFHALGWAIGLRAPR
ncbi:2TM domain-containing protein [Agromyces sp. SYSU T00194]|uniref:2TM domain-containing protein n=1 Tax=Agromyces chitinivorans TaxID=3158560 RepID=UPI003391A39E